MGVEIYSVGLTEKGRRHRSAINGRS